MTPEAAVGAGEGGEPRSRVRFREGKASHEAVVAVLVEQVRPSLEFCPVSGYCVTWIESPMRHFFAPAILLAFLTLPLLFACQKEANTTHPPGDAGGKLPPGNPMVALRLEAMDDHDSVRLSVFLENLTDKPIKLRDQTSPAFSPWPCLNAKVDGKEVHLEARAAFTFVDKAEERTIDAKKRFKLGDVLVTAKGSQPGKNESAVPLLFVEPGTTHAIELSLKRDELGIPGPVSPASIKVKVTVAKGH
jgi:hypothetical protein